MAKRSTEEVGVNMTPMIDIVFQLIIFFVVTVELDRQAFDETIVLARSPHGPTVEKRDPRTVYVEVHEDGTISIARNRLSEARLVTVLTQARIAGRQDTPVHIRAHQSTRHEFVRRAMQAAGKAGLYRVSFVALKEKAPSN